jgi:UDP-2,4-diacetamido-2,4,6-trideoxy-beta-L-altropyranose hydrolase
MAETLLIRTDASPDKGIGHVMRMIGLAQAWLEKGGVVTFCAVHLPASLRARLEAEGFEIEFLEAEIIGSPVDAEQTLFIARICHAKWIVMDGYDFDLDYQKALAQGPQRTMIFKDFETPYGWYADYVVSAVLPRFEGSKGRNHHPNGNSLDGIEFVILRKEFWEIPSFDRSTDSGKPEPVKHLLVLSGGSDPLGLAIAILKTLEQEGLPNIEIRVVSGSMNPHLESLQELSKVAELEIELKIDVTDMVSEYRWADKVITAAGGTAWELMRMNRSIGVIPVAENQIGLTDFLVCHGHATQLGSGLGDHIDVDSNELNRWLRGPDKFNRTQEDPILDGQGARRLCSLMRAND